MTISIRDRKLQKTEYRNFDSVVEGRMESESRQQRVHKVSAAKAKELTDRLDNMLLERILFPDNLFKAMKKVIANKGKPGIDGMETTELDGFLLKNGVQIRKALLEGTYKPQPVRRVEIPKPNGGIRLLGIPTVVDRFIQQAIAQVLNEEYDKTFSRNSFGFRPGRSAKHAIKRATAYMDEGYKWVVDLDLEKFFDKVNHDRLMYTLSKKIVDKRVLKLIRLYLQSGIMIDGLVKPSTEGTPQGGPLSPLLSNIVLDELDKELERRGHRFCRYADDCNIYVKSERAGRRVMSGITEFIESKLRLKVNRDKSAVDRPWNRKFLGFQLRVRGSKNAYAGISEVSLKRYKDKVRNILSRSNAMSIGKRISKLNMLNVGWINYYGIAKCKRLIHKLDSWIKRRLRMCIWRQWKRVRARYKRLVALGTYHYKALRQANTRRGCWNVSKNKALTTTLTNKYFEDLGLKSMPVLYLKVYST